MTIDEVGVKLFDEVEYVWPKVGYPPLVTPFSQYVKNIALMNILAEAQGKPRYSLLTDKSIWGMILGKSGQLPGEVAPEIKELAKEQGLEFFTGDVQALYPDNMDDFRKEMKENGWETGPDDEELFELAMHPEHIVHSRAVWLSSVSRPTCRRPRMRRWLSRASTQRIF